MNYLLWGLKINAYARRGESQFEKVENTFTAGDDEAAKKIAEERYPEIIDKILYREIHKQEFVL